MLQHSFYVTRSKSFLPITTEVSGEEEGLSLPHSPPQQWHENGPVEILTGQLAIFKLKA